MRRFIVAILCLILAAPIIAQVPTPANVTAQLTEQNAKREDAERKLMIREAADELEDAQTEQAYNRFEIVMGAWGVYCCQAIFQLLSSGEFETLQLHFFVLS